MKQILEMLDQMDKFDDKQEKYEMKKDELKRKKREIEELNQKVKLSMMGTYDRGVAKSIYEQKKTEFEELKKQIEETRKEMLNEFEMKKIKVIYAIDEKIIKYRNECERADTTALYKDTCFEISEDFKKINDKKAILTKLEYLKARLKNINLDDLKTTYQKDTVMTVGTQKTSQIIKNEKVNYYDSEDENVIEM